MKTCTLLKLSVLSVIFACTSIPPKKTADGKYVPGDSPEASKPQAAAKPSAPVRLSLNWNKLKRGEKIDLNLKLTNDLDVGLDLSKTLVSLVYDGQKGIIYGNDFERIVVGPNSAREGVILFKFDKRFEENKPFEITMENVRDFNGKLLPPMKLQFSETKSTSRYK